MSHWIPAFAFLPIRDRFWQGPTHRVVVGTEWDKAVRVPSSCKASINVSWYYWQWVRSRRGIYLKQNKRPQVGLPRKQTPRWSWACRSFYEECTWSQQGKEGKVEPWFSLMAVDPIGRDLELNWPFRNDPVGLRRQDFIIAHRSVPGYRSPGKDWPWVRRPSATQAVPQGATSTPGNQDKSSTKGVPEECIPRPTYNISQAKKKKKKRQSKSIPWPSGKEKGQSAEL